MASYHEVSEEKRANWAWRAIQWLAARWWLGVRSVWRGRADPAWAFGTFGVVLVLWFIAVVIARSGRHIDFILDWTPTFIWAEARQGQYTYSPFNHSCVMLAVIVAIAPVAVGYFVWRWIVGKEAMFKAIGLGTGKDASLSFLEEKKLDEYRKEIRLKVERVHLWEFRHKQSEIERTLGLWVQSIEAGAEGTVVIILTTLKFPENARFAALVEAKPLGAGAFYAGATEVGGVAVSIDAVRHVVVAGGDREQRASFVQQMVCGLMESTPGLSVVGIDLRTTSVFDPFARCNRLKVVQGLTEIAATLEGIDAQAKTLIVIPDAPALLTTRNRWDEGFFAWLALKRRLEEIATARGPTTVHLLIVTPKPAAKALPPSIFDHLTVRLLFEMPHPDERKAWLGEAKGTFEIKHPGRAIWLCDGKAMVVQTPEIEAEEVQWRSNKGGDA